jgi:hypothetical protein
VSVWIAFVYWIISSIAVPIGTYAFSCWIPPIWGDEAGEDGIVVAGVEEQEPRFRIVPLADVAFALAATCAVVVLIKPLTKRLVVRVFVLASVNTSTVTSIKPLSEGFGIANPLN